MKDVSEFPPQELVDFDPAALARVPDGALQASLCRLLTLHALQPCPRKAHTIARLLGALLEHPAARRCPMQQRVYREALDIWTRIAADLARLAGGTRPNTVLH